MMYGWKLWYKRILKVLASAHKRVPIHLLMLALNGLFCLSVQVCWYIKYTIGLPSMRERCVKNGLNWLLEVTYEQREDEGHIDVLAG